MIEESLLLRFRRLLFLYQFLEGAVELNHRLIGRRLHLLRGLWPYTLDLEDLLDRRLVELLHSQYTYARQFLGQP